MLSGGQQEAILQLIVSDKTVPDIKKNNAKTKDKTIILELFINIFPP
jgi:hypothetical protein